MTWEEASGFYGMGNEAFSRGEFEKAVFHYQEALQRLQKASQDTDEVLRVKLLSNTALCHLQLRNYQEAMSLCTDVLQIDQHNVKALIRRAKAKEQLEDFISARNDIRRCLEIFKLDPNNLYHPLENPRPVSAAEKDAISSLFRLERLIARDQQVQRQELHLRPDSFVTPCQSLGLHFGDVAPDCLEEEQGASIRLFVANEFGLWSRDLLHAATGESSVKVLCEVLSVPHGSSSGFTVISKGARDLEETGRLNFEFFLSRQFDDDGDSQLSKFVMLKFFCDKPLPSGHEVAPIVTLPIRVSERQRSLNKDANSCDINKNRDGSDINHRNDDLENQISSLLAQCKRLGGQSIKVFELHHGGAGNAVIYALECPGSLGIGGKVWDASFGLMEYFSYHPELLRNKVVIELGSGTGLAGLGLSGTTAPPLQVVLTDVSEVVSLLQTNILLNRVMTSSEELHSFLAVSHHWGESVQRLAELVQKTASDNSEMFEGLLLVASDVVYDPSGYDPLIASIKGLLNKQWSSSNFPKWKPPMMVLTHRQRNSENVKFFEGLQAGESPLIVNKEEMHWQRTPEDVEVFLIHPTETAAH